MSFDYKNIDSHDDFSRQVGEKLKSHSSPVDPHVWESIEKRLPISKRRVATAWWWVGSAAAAVIGLLFLLQPFSIKESAQSEIVVQQHRTKAVTTEKMPGENESKESAVIEMEKKTVYAQRQTPSASAKTEERPEKEEKTSLIASYLQNKLKDKHTAKTANTPTSLPPAPTKTEKADNPSFVPEKQSQEELFAVEEKSIKEPESKLNKETKLIARLGGLAGNTGLSFNGRQDMAYADQPIGSELGNTTKDTYNSLTPSDYSEIQHLPPVSVSIMAEFPINRTWSLETGLMYTYLASKYKKPEGNVYLGTLHLHYLGLPINLKMNMYQNDSWRVYVLGGGSIEKGIASVYKQTIQYQSGTDHHLIKRSSMKGFQFSSHVAAGFDYKINQNIRLFGEPYLIYYFNNNQPMSARTENPLTFGFNTGIRIQF